MEQHQRTRLVTLLILALVFGTGIVVGLAVDRTAAASPQPEMTAEADEQEAEGSDDEQDHRRRRRPMWEQVGELSSDQEASIDSIVEYHRNDMRRLQREFEAEYNPRYWALIEDTREAIKNVMSPSQAMAYDSLLAEYDRRRQRRTREEGSDTVGR